MADRAERERIVGDRNSPPGTAHLLLVLQAAVPLRMLELRDRPAEELCALAEAQSQEIVEHADTAMYGGAGAGQATAALITALAALALAAEGGVTFAGLHWGSAAPECGPADALDGGEGR